MVFLTLRAAWLRRQRAKKQLTAAKNNVKKANNVVKRANTQYNAVKRVANSPPRQNTVMRLVRVKNMHGVHNMGISNAAYNNFKRRYTYVSNSENRQGGYYVLKN